MGGISEVSKWLSAVSAARAFLSDTTCLTPTARQTEPGKLTSARLRLWLTAQTLLFTSAPVAFVRERSSALKIKNSALRQSFLIILSEFQLFLNAQIILIQGMRQKS